MRQGDFTTLAREYVNRAGYSHLVLRTILRHVTDGRDGAPISVADVGAGTGKLTEDLLAIGIAPLCVEPNDAMREEGARITAGRGVRWVAGSGEQTNLGTASADWILMGSSFHWVDPASALAEFHRVLRPGGFFTALWNPRNIAGNALHTRIEQRICDIVPDLKRVSSGAPHYTDGLFATLVSTGHFADAVCVEALHDVVMTPDRYLGAWRSVNDIQAQAGPDRWPRVLDAIEAEIAGLDEIVVPYRTRAFTVRRRDVAGR